MKRSIGVTALLVALALGTGLAGCASGPQAAPSSGAPSGPAGGGSY
ncbi:hypothetical protein QCE63_29140 [Caballeronia sp. LZ065]|nr:hypothetical protein [Caballeronia sp. LZ065]MDR5783484.1 hypothetical protein [Caballeronia sp. LZ065]